ncbi:hypothetical protein N752_18180 [Desulforamulus aquiferis]|nr:hypothetical protein [Desulforamulus aquiferis]RYD03677.1 hypothetical protein N752_18180 [Desulforamulus aquiferis]
MLAGNWGEVRLYVLLGLVIGALIYLNLLSKNATRLLQLVFRLINRLWKILIQMVSIALKIICLPFRLVYLSVAIPLGILGLVFNKTWWGIKFILNKVIGQPIRRGRKGIRRKLASIFPIFEYKDDK